MIEKLNQEKKYSSIYLVEQINIFRAEEGNKSLILHKNLIAKIEKEFSDEIDGLKIQPVDYAEKIINGEIKM